MGHAWDGRLSALADRGEADREAGRPIRYKANAATAAAATAVTRKAPAPPKPAALQPSSRLAR